MSLQEWKIMKCQFTGMAWAVHVSFPWVTRWKIVLATSQDI